MVSALRVAASVFSKMAGTEVRAQHKLFSRAPRQQENLQDAAIFATWLAVPSETLLLSAKNFFIMSDHSSNSILMAVYSLKVASLRLNYRTMHMYMPLPTPWHGIPPYPPFASPAAVVRALCSAAASL